MKKDIPLHLICAGTQVRASMSEEYIAELKELQKAGTEFPPVVVFVTKDQRDRPSPEYLLADGFHRVEAASRSGAKNINADVRQGGRSDCLKFALGANASHGLRRTNADKRRAVELALGEWSNLSDAELGRICAVSHPFVASVRRELQPVTITGSTRIGADGKTRKVPVPPALSPAKRISSQRLRKLEAALKDAPPATEGTPSELLIEVKSGNTVSSLRIANTIEAITEAINNEKRLATDSGKPPGLPAGAAKASLRAERLDQLGRAIPEKLISLWNEAEKATELLSALSSIKSTLDRLEAEHPLVLHEVNLNPVKAKLVEVRSDLKLLKPYAVCTNCQGLTPDKCRFCGGRGFISELKWDKFVPKETKQMMHNTTHPK